MENEELKADASKSPANENANPVAASPAAQVAKPVVKPAPKPVAKPAAKPIAKAATKPVAKAVAKSVAKSDSKPAVKVKTPEVKPTRVKKGKREKINYELRIDLLGKAIKKARKERDLTQKELGQLVGVKKAQISKLENSLTDARFETIIKVFKALNVKINFNVELLDQTITLS